MKRNEQPVIAAVARHFSTKPVRGSENSPKPYLTIAGKRVAIEVATINANWTERPRLRFDKVALRFVADLGVALRALIPDGQTAMIAITAPIRSASKTAAAVEKKIRTSSAKPAALEIRESILGNQVRVRPVSAIPKGLPKVIGFVHNPETDADALLHFVEMLVQAVGAAAGKRARRNPADERWLIIAPRNGDARTYRDVCHQLPLGTEFSKILLMSADGRVEMLSG